MVPTKYQPDLLQLLISVIGGSVLNKVTWIIFSVITVAFLTILVVFSKTTEIDISKVDVNVVQLASKQNGNIADHVYGDADSPVTLIEYGDYQCSHCASMQPFVEAVTKQYQDKLKFIFRNFPLGASFPNSKAAAATVEAAGLQGKYWEMHNKIYDQQSDWTDLSGTNRTATFVSYAKELELDTDKFTEDISSSAIISKINYDQALGQKVGITGTPAFYLNGTQLDLSDIGTEASLRSVIEAALKKAGL